LKRLAQSASFRAGECDVEYEAEAKSWIDGLWTSSRRRRKQRLLVLCPPLLWATRTALPHWLTQSKPVSVAFAQEASCFNKNRFKQGSPALRDRPDGSGLTYEAGDALGVVPVNCHELVDDVIATLRCNPDENVKAGRFRVAVA